MTEVRGRLLRVTVKPGSRSERVEEKENRITVYIKEKAKEGLANERLREILAQRYNVPLSKIRIRTGRNKPQKLIEILN